MEYPIRPGALMMTPTGRSAVVVELCKHTVMLLYLNRATEDQEEDLTLEMTRGVVSSWPITGYCSAAQLDKVLPKELKDPLTLNNIFVDSGDFNHHTVSPIKESDRP